jgi:hypothetical protein
VIDSVNAFSVRGHYRISGTSRPLPTTLKKGETLEVRVTFDRPDNGTTQGSMRVYSNDERSLTTTVRLVGTVGATSVEDDRPIDRALEAMIVPNPVTSDGEITVNILESGMIERMKIAVIDVTGSVVAQIYDGVVQGTSMTFAVPTTIASGSYTLSIETPIGKSATSFVVTR